MSERLTVVATPEELALVKDKRNYIVTGVGALNVIQVLKDVPRETPLLNVGYAGSNSLDIGERVTIGEVHHYHPNVSYQEPAFHLLGNVPCYTGGDFVLETGIETPCVFDMELAYILALGFKDVISEKVVSDNLCYIEYCETIGGNNG